MNLGAAFRSTATDPIAAWPSLGQNAVIPDAMKSASAEPKRRSKVSLTILDCLCKILMGEVQLSQSNRQIAVQYQASTGPRLLTSEPSSGGTGRAWSGEMAAPSSPFMLAMAEAVLIPLAQVELRTRWFNFVSVLTNAVGHHAPFSSDELAQLSQGTFNNEQIMGVLDACYFAAKSMLTQDFEENGVTNPDPNLSPCGGRWYAAAVSGNSELQSVVSTAERVTRLVRRGGAVLMCGPTGTLKTETAKRAALDAEATLRIVKGRAGLEDRELLGSVTPTEDGPRWFDGPVTQAFRLAQRERVTLIVDELTRFESFHQALFIGALDTVSTDELAALGIAVASAERHRVIELPSGERIAAPCSNLSLIATCNLGDEYVQAGATLDAALLGRFDLVIDVVRADPAVTWTLYAAAGVSEASARAAERLEQWTHHQTVETDGLLQRELNPRVVLALLAEQRALIADGLDESVAFLEAARCTVIPFCAPRTPSGRLEASAVRVLEDEVANIGGTL